MKLHQILFIRPSSLRLANISVSYQTGYPINDFWFTVTAHAQNAQNKPAHIISRALVRIKFLSFPTIVVGARATIIAGIGVNFGMSCSTVCLVRIRQDWHSHRATQYGGKAKIKVIPRYRVRQMVVT